LRIAWTTILDFDEVAVLHEGVLVEIWETARLVEDELWLVQYFV